MSTEVIITGIRGTQHYDLPLEGRIMLRGRRRANPQPGECQTCKDEIATGEQYIRCGGEFGESYCLGCAEYE